jgi:acetate kinase
MLGLTGFKDMRDVLGRTGWRVPGIAAVEPKDEDERKWCRLAVDVFCYDVARYIGQFSAVMGGVDAVIFTAGVGERNQFLRDRIMGLVKLPGKPKTMVVPTNEELMIAKETEGAIKGIK